MQEICPSTMELWPSKEISLFYKYDFYYEDQTTEQKPWNHLKNYNFKRVKVLAGLGGYVD